jgi:hypothetical protein
MKLLSAVTAALVLAIAAPAGATSLTTALNGYRTEAQFVNPPDNSGTPDSGPVLSRIADMIHSVPNNGTIVMGIYSIDDPGVMQALRDVTAPARNVTVYAVQSGDQNHAAGQGQELHDLLTVDPESEHRWCGGSFVGSDGKTYSDWACNADAWGVMIPYRDGVFTGTIEPGNDCSPGPCGIQHEKFMLFSQARDLAGTLRSNVTWFGTANLTGFSGAQTFNETTTVYDDVYLYNEFFYGLFLPMWNQSPRTKDYPRTDTSHFFTDTGTGIELNASPSSDEDLVVSQLAKISRGSSCQVRVMQQHLTRPEVATELANMSRQGCSVWVLAYDLGPASCQALKASGANVTVKRYPNAVHSKTIITHGQAGHDNIYTGSHNLNTPALRSDDEILARLPVDGSGLYSAYVSHFNTAWGRVSATVSLAQC